MGKCESRYGDDTKGNYWVVLPDGRRQNVDYHVDGYSGYVADVSYDGYTKSNECKADYQTTNYKTEYKTPKLNPFYEAADHRGRYKEDKKPIKTNEEYGVQVTKPQEYDTRPSYGPADSIPSYGEQYTRGKEQYTETVDYQEEKKSSPIIKEEYRPNYQLEYAPRPSYGYNPVYGQEKESEKYRNREPKYKEENTAVVIKPNYQDYESRPSSYGSSDYIPNYHNKQQHSIYKPEYERRPTPSYGFNPVYGKEKEEKYNYETEYKGEKTAVEVNFKPSHQDYESRPSSYESSDHKKQQPYSIYKPEYDQEYERRPSYGLNPVYGKESKDLYQVPWHKLFYDKEVKRPTETYDKYRDFALEPLREYGQRPSYGYKTQEYQEEKKGPEERPNYYHESLIKQSHREYPESRPSYGSLIPSYQQDKYSTPIYEGKQEKYRPNYQHESVSRPLEYEHHRPSYGSAEPNYNHRWQYTRPAVYKADDKEEYSTADAVVGYKEEKKTEEYQPAYNNPEKAKEYEVGYGLSSDPVLKEEEKEIKIEEPLSYKTPEYKEEKKETQSEYLIKPSQQEYKPSPSSKPEYNENYEIKEVKPLPVSKPVEYLPNYQQKPVPLAYRPISSPVKPAVSIPTINYHHGQPIPIYKKGKKANVPVPAPVIKVEYRPNYAHQPAAAFNPVKYVTQPIYTPNYHRGQQFNPIYQPNSRPLTPQPNLYITQLPQPQAQLVRTKKKGHQKGLNKNRPKKLKHHTTATNY